MTALAKSRGIWLNSKNTRLPRQNLKTCAGNIRYVYFDLQASETNKIWITSYVDGTMVKEEEVQLKVWDRDGKARAFFFPWPSTALTEGPHIVNIETGPSDCKNAWRSPDYEIYICA